MPTKHKGNEKIFILALFVTSCLTLNAQEDKTYTSLEEAFKTPDQVYNLDLDYNQLTSIPESIGKLTNLTDFYLSNNQLSESEKEKIKKIVEKLLTNKNNDNDLSGKEKELEILRRFEEEKRDVLREGGESEIFLNQVILCTT